MNKCERKIIYVLCPALLKTGGTELLHQLVYKLNQVGLTAVITYIPVKDSECLNPVFSEYVDSYILETDIVDIEDNILIIPETYTYFIPRYYHISIFVWWLSVDNYMKNNMSSVYKHFMMFQKEYGVLNEMIRISARLIMKKHREKRQIPIKDMQRVEMHLVQSVYATDFLKKQGVNNIHYLSDYINNIYIRQANNVKINQKEDIVVYNPRKGKRFTKEIIKVCNDICFIPLVGMKNEQIIEVLKKAKLYIDFGGHPGKDRLPREAAIMKCCIITGRRGSAGYNDVFIDSEFKFNDVKKNIPLIATCIRNILSDYKSYVNKFEEYRKIIIGEEKQFETDIREIFINEIVES